MFAIEQSAGSDDIKKALEKNPDISKERNNLLQGKISLFTERLSHNLPTWLMLS